MGGVEIFLRTRPALVHTCLGWTRSGPGNFRTRLQCEKDRYKTGVAKACAQGGVGGEPRIIQHTALAPAFEIKHRDHKYKPGRGGTVADQLIAELLVHIADIPLLCTPRRGSGRGNS